jgi:hypothetical protein
MPKQMPRPNLSEFFKAKIDQHVNGMLATSTVRLPNTVRRVSGSVEDAVIEVTMTDGTVYKWSGGQYSTRKVRGCYAPLMPKPIKD